MEGALGSTRMGSRSSTRHGPASVFQGRVRRWKKSWAPVAPSSTPSSAAVCRVLLYKWTPLTVPSTNGAKESTPEEPPPAKPLRFLPVSVVLQQKKEAQKAAEEVEVLARLEKEAGATTDLAVETGGAEAKDIQEDTNMGGTQTEEMGVNVTDSKDQGVEGDAQTTRAELAASLQDETPAPPQDPESASMDVDQSKS